MLELTGMPWGAVFLATIISATVGTLVMGLFANVPYAQAPGMGLNAFFTYTVCFALGFSWQQALAMVFLCGVVNIIITVTRIRKAIIKAIPVSLQNAIGGGIGIFIAYIGVKNAGLINFTSDPGKNVILEGGTVISDASAVPALVTLNNPVVILAIIGLVIMTVLLIFKVKGAILIGIAATTVIGIPMGVVNLSELGGLNDFSSAFSELGTTFGAAFGSEGLGSLFSDASKIPLVLMTIFAFSLSDTFDTIGTFIGRAGEAAYSALKILKRWIQAKVSNQRWTRHCLPTLLQPQSEQFSAHPIQPHMLRARQVSARADAPGLQAWLLPFCLLHQSF